MLSCRRRDRDRVLAGRCRFAGGGQSGRGPPAGARRQDELRRQPARRICECPARLLVGQRDRAGKALRHGKQPHIVCCDCGEDPAYRFADIGNLVRKARIDFGVEIRLVSREELVRLRRERTIGIPGTAYDRRRKIIPYCLDSTPLSRPTPGPARRGVADAAGGLMQVMHGTEVTPDVCCLAPGSVRLDTVWACGRGS
jgi:hypothetical protein